MDNEQQEKLLNSESEKSESEQQEKLPKSESEKEESEEDESESESEEDESGSETELDLDWESKPIEYLKEKYEDDPCPCYFSCDRFVYKNKAMIKQEEDSEKAVNEYWESSRNISPYDAIPVPPLANLRLSNFPRPITITEGWRPRFIHLSKLALENYNHDNQGLVYVFEDIVKAVSQRIPLTTFYITFKAKPKDHNIILSSTFQAHVWDRITELGPPVVKSCSILI